MFNTLMHTTHLPTRAREYVMTIIKLLHELQYIVVNWIWGAQHYRLYPTLLKKKTNNNQMQKGIQLIWVSYTCTMINLHASKKVTIHFYF